MKLSILPAIAATALMASASALHADNAVADGQKLTQIRYDNYVYCAAYSYNSAEFIEANEGADAASGEFETANGISEKAKTVGKELSKQSKDVDVEIDRVKEKMWVEGNALNHSDFQIWEQKLTEHCLSVLDNGPALDKPFTP